jgi:hypothetical protein
MKVNLFSIKYCNLRKLSFKHGKRKRKQRKRHAETFFNSRLKKFVFYYSKFNRLAVLKQNKTSSTFNRTEPVNKYLIGLRALRMTYVTVYPLRSVIKLSKRYLKNVEIAKYIKYKISIFPDF